MGIFTGFFKNFNTGVVLKSINEKILGGTGGTFTLKMGCRNRGIIGL